VAISFNLTVRDPDLENLLVYLDGVAHLSSLEKEVLLSRGIAWLKMARAASCPTADFAPSVYLGIGGKQVLHEPNSRNYPPLSERQDRVQTHVKS